MNRTLLATLVVAVAAFGSTAARADNSAEPQWPNTPTHVKPVMTKGMDAKPMDKMQKMDRMDHQTDKMDRHTTAPVKQTDYRFLTDYGPA